MEVDSLCGSFRRQADKEGIIDKSALQRKTASQFATESVEDAVTQGSSRSLSSAHPEKIPALTRLRSWGSRRIQFLSKRFGSSRKTTRQSDGDQQPFDSLDRSPSSRENSQRRSWSRNSQSAHRRGDSQTLGSEFGLEGPKDESSVRSRDGSRRSFSERLREAFRRSKEPRSIFPKSKGEIEKDYDIGNIVGKGQFGAVCSCTDRVTGQSYACKTLLKESLYLQENIDTVRNEVEIHLAVQSHPNIVTLREVYEDKYAVNLIMDYCKGGTLTDYIMEQGNYSERAAARLIRDIVKIVDHCHKLGVVHRDIKLSNFLLADESDEAPVMAIDFGVSSFFKPGVPLTRLEGSPFYIAPEVLEESYGPECDIWSCGVCLYILLCGEPPFNGATVLKTFKLVKEAALDFDKEPWTNISASAKELISSMLSRDPSKRPTTEQILAHPWTQEDMPDVPLGSIVLPRLRQFCALSKFQQLARMVVAESLTDEELAGLKRVFIAVDTNKNGVITLDELRNGLQTIGHGLNADTITEIMQKADVDGDGTIDYTEFLGATLKMNREKKEQRLAAVFKQLDINGDGYLSRNEIEALCKRYRVGDLHSIVEALDKFKNDKPHDRLIDYNEFMETMSDHESKARLLVL